MKHYRADIDGLRAVAVLLVVFYHAGWPLFSGGFIGVDVFFVISGFLITSIILDGVNKCQFSFRQFYLRRARRLLPALLLVITVSALASYWLLSPKHMLDFAKSLAATMVFSSNLYFMSESDYFAGTIDLKPLIHTWSLAVEEQYYLLFPLLMVLLARFRKSLFVIMVILFLCSFAFAAWAFSSIPKHSFYFLLSRAWELLAGSLLAIMFVNHAGRAETLYSSPLLSRLLHLLGWIGLLAIFIAGFVIDKHAPFWAHGTGIGLWVAVVGTVLVLLGSQPNTLLNRVLSFRPIVFVGLLSYSLYLWHQPVLAFARHYLAAPLDAVTSCFALLISLLMAYVSWRFVEKPIRHAKVIVSNKLFVVLMVSLSILGIAFGVVAYNSQGFESRYSLEAIAVYTHESSKHYNWSGCRHSPCNDNHGKPTVLLVGDSHAAAISQFLNNELDSGYDYQWSAAAACPPLIGYIKSRQDGSDCSGRNEQLLHRVAKDDNIEWVILVGHWGTYSAGKMFNNGAGGVDDGASVFYMTETLQERFSQQRAEAIADGYVKTLEAFLDTGKKILVVDQIPVAGWDVPEAVLALQHRGADPGLELRYEQGLYEEFASSAQAMMQLEANNLVTLPTVDLFCEQNKCLVVKNDQPLYVDTNHLGPHGATILAKAINECIIQYDRKKK